MALKTFRLLSAANNDNATVAFDSPESVRHIIGYNAKASAVYLKIYALKSTLAAPANTDTPILTLYLPASAPFQFNFGPDLINDAFGLGIRLVTGSADADATAVLAGDILGLNIVAS